MSRFFSENYKDLVAYVPGEQPADLSRFVKLNTNENPFPPSQKALEYAAQNTRPAHLYSDPDCRKLTALLAKTYGVEPENVICGNGSDELLFFAFSAFCSDDVPAVCPDISYGFTRSSLRWPEYLTSASLLTKTLRSIFRSIR